MIRRLALAVIAASLFPASLATAHPGHGRDGDGHSLQHYLTEPLHLAAGIAVAAAVISVIWLLRKFARSATAVGPAKNVRRA